ncbi:hypothetical protein ACF3NG_07020 [Aerococcaceae bacterium WGS1372]
MWIEKLDNGKYKFVERYEDEATGKSKRVSVTMTKKTKEAQAEAFEILQSKMKKNEKR